MCMCMCMCMCACACVCVCVCKRLREYLCMCQCVSMCVCVCAWVHLGMRACVFACVIQRFVCGLSLLALVRVLFCAHRLCGQQNVNLCYSTCVFHTPCASMHHYECVWNNIPRVHINPLWLSATKSFRSIPDLNSKFIKNIWAGCSDSRNFLCSETSMSPISVARFVKVCGNTIYLQARYVIQRIQGGSGS